MSATAKASGVGHPLAALTAEEISAATAAVRRHPRFTDTWRFAYVGLEEPPKDLVRAFSPGDPVDRAVRMVMVTGSRGPGHRGGGLGEHR